MIAVVIVIIPIALRVPAMLVFIPPSVDADPAALACLSQFLTCALGLPASESMPRNRLVQSVVRARNPALAIAFVGAHKRHRSEH